MKNEVMVLGGIKERKRSKYRYTTRQKKEGTYTDKVMVLGREKERKR